MHSLLLGLALSPLLPAPPLRAPAGADASYEVRFDDDDLLAPGTSPYAEWLTVRGAAPRVGLLRPRVSFVPELLRTAVGL
ncbi:MAG: hypothetical protein FJ104_02930 [Deltaproteobacteria bacterium]|nr:hypothetical protein [Deltaproteobacteria bacterium]